jgi:site-specific DNA-methyltransferase (cytosine-N4-specific)
MALDTCRLFWHDYRYFEYEKQLALRELASITGSPVDSVELDDSGVTVESDVPSEKLRDLVYFERFEQREEEHWTLQGLLEGSCSVSGTTRRQSTRYSVHGIHEYKGKFNPQVVRAILNTLPANGDGFVFDPFCGSGTTLAECSHAGISSLGSDLNPLAVFIANEKQRLLRTSAKSLEEDFHRIIQSFRRGKSRVTEKDWPAEHLDYLYSWFEADVLGELDRLRRSVERSNQRSRGLFLVVISDLLRDYSLQEPADLRIRRRRSPPPTTPLIDAFMMRCDRAIESIKMAQAVIEAPLARGTAFHADSRNLPTALTKKARKKVSAIITSPPYATALPYIDTQRLSLVWLKLLSPRELRKYEHDLTGTREMSTKSKNDWRDSLRDNTSNLPQQSSEFCGLLQGALGQEDGFRRQAVPKLLYKYLTDMKHVFKSMRDISDPGTPFALVIGTNSTTLGGKQFTIDTPSLLADVAMSEKWSVEEKVSLDTYQRYGLHARNAVSSEELLVLRADG